MIHFYSSLSPANQMTRICLPWISLSDHLNHRDTPSDASRFFKKTQRRADPNPSPPGHCLPIQTLAHQSPLQTHPPSPLPLRWPQDPAIPRARRIRALWPDLPPSSPFAARPSPLAAARRPGGTTRWPDPRPLAGSAPPLPGTLSELDDEEDERPPPAASPPTCPPRRSTSASSSLPTSSPSLRVADPMDAAGYSPGTTTHFSRQTLARSLPLSLGSQLILIHLDAVVVF
jgi:hypothetical protein